MIGYLITEYPKISHTFIRREILALESLGVTVTRFAFRGWDYPLVDDIDETEQSKTEYLLKMGAGPLITAFFKQLFLSPSRVARALLKSSRLMRRSDRSVYLHLITFLEACLLSQKMQIHSIKHLHAHFGTNSAECAMLASIISGIQYSFTAHGPDEFDKNQFCHLTQKIAHAKFVVGVSAFGKGQLQRWANPEDFDKIKQVHCGLSEDMFFNDQASQDLGHNFVCVARLSRQKGHMVLVRAFAGLIRSGSKAHLTLIGDGDMRHIIEQIIAEERIQNCVTLLGWADQQTIRNEILRARAFVLTSYAEGLPVVFMEAMALGRVVLATNVAGNAELVEHGKTGWLFPSGSVSGATWALQQCLATKNQDILTMGIAARERVRGRHLQVDQAKRLSSLFNNPIQKNSSIDRD
jgi:colanic acid/amylovoran biosynthesis glycosyltransferase